MLEFVDQGRGREYFGYLYKTLDGEECARNTDRDMSRIVTCSMK